MADITYLPLRKGTAYANLVTDAWSRKIMGYCVHESLHMHHVARAFKNGSDEQANGLSAGALLGLRHPVLLHKISKNI